LHLDLIYYYKIVFGVVNLNFSDFFEFSLVTAARGHAYKLYKPNCVNSRLLAVGILQREWSMYGTFYHQV